MPPEIRLSVNSANQNVIWGPTIKLLAQGIRAAEPQDIVALQALLKPLEDKGILLGRSQEQLTAELHLFTVTCRESKVFGCAQLKSLGIDASGRRVTELAAFCIDPAFRGAGRGDSLLEYCGERKGKCWPFRGFCWLILCF